MPLLIDAIVGAIAGGALSLAGVGLHAALTTRRERTAEQRGRLADAAVSWMTAVARTAHMNNEKQDEVRDALAALTDAKLRLVVLGNEEIWAAMRRVEEFPRIAASEEGREAFRQVVHAFRRALDRRGAKLDAATIDALLLGEGDASVAAHPRSWL